jgi:hypothetical protein
MGYPVQHTKAKAKEEESDESESGEVMTFKRSPFWSSNHVFRDSIPAQRIISHRQPLSESDTRKQSPFCL